MIRKNAIKLISKNIGNSPIISANGYISRDLFEVDDKKSNFYMIGSMGLSSSIALGISLNYRKKKIYVFDGDGNILMNLGSLVTIGALKPKNFVHIVFDNSIHESTGGQPTNSAKVNLDKIARAVNFTVIKIPNKKKLISSLKTINRIKGPIMLIVKVEKCNVVSKRVEIKPKLIHHRFAQFLKIKT
jgi:thiamine pyrophosphate-dependent acetolactate synthase large subunit-like protein